MNRREYMLQAQMRKNDEFYTQYSDIENELQYYRTHFADKVVYCNCDDPLKSEFTRYFANNFSDLKLKKLISTYYSPTSLFESKPALIQIKDSRGIHTGTLRGDGDFRSPECIDLLQKADIVVTNPPFSLFREYISLLLKYEKQFLILGTQGAIIYKCFFPSVRDGDVWIGRTCRSGEMVFNAPLNNVFSVAKSWIEKDKQYVRITGVRWYTNMDHGHHPPPLELTEKYSPERYPRYDNFDAINVDRTCDIPMDYDGVMGVPISYLVKYCPEQFDLLGGTQRCSEYRKKIYAENHLNAGPALKVTDPCELDNYYVEDGEYYRALYARILIQRKKA